MTAEQWLNEQTYPAEDQNLAASAVVYIKKGEGRSLKAGGQWIYDNEVDRVEGDPADGDTLRNKDGLMTETFCATRMVPRTETSSATRTVSLTETSSASWTTTDIPWDSDSSTPHRRSASAC